MVNKLFFGLTAIGIPISIIGGLMDWSPILMFVIYSLTIISLAGLIGKSTESLAIVLGQRIGGLLNATFGNAVELIISIFALKSGLITIVLASLRSEERRVGKGCICLWRGGDWREDGI